MSHNIRRPGSKFQRKTDVTQRVTGLSFMGYLFLWGAGLFRLTLYEGQDLLILLFGLALLHQVDLVLQDEDVLQLHDLYGCQVLRCLGLRA